MIKDLKTKTKKSKGLTGRVSKGNSKEVGSEAGVYLDQGKVKGVGWAGGQDLVGPYL